MSSRDGGVELGTASRTVQLLTPEPEENAGTATCRFCIRQRGVCLGLVLLVAADVAASVVLASAGRQEVLFLCIFRGVLLAFGFTVAVKMGLGVWSCACCNSQTASAREDRPQTINDPNDPAVSVSGSFTSAVATLAELERQRAAVATREAHSWKRNLVLAICFVGISVQSVYAGIQVLTWADETPVDAICFTLVVACMNAEFFLVKLLVERLTEEEGVLLQGVHEHRLYYQKVAEIAHCKVCRERIGQRTGGHEGFKCRECDSSAGGRGPMGTGGTFWVCLQCYRKHQNTNAQEGILRGDKGPKYVPELTSWEYFKRALNLCKPFQTVLQCAVICTIITQVIRVLLPRYQGDIINSLIDQDREAFSSKLLAYLLFSIFTMLFGSVQSVCVEIVHRRITCDMRTVMFESLIKQDIAFFDGTMTGQLTSRMTNDVAAVVQPVRQILNTFLTSILRLIGGLFMCLFTSWKLTVLAATMIGPVVYLTGVYAKWSKKLNMAIRVNMADANAVSTEALRNIRTVRSFGADSLEVAAFRGHMDQALHGGMKDAYASAGVSAITQYLDFAATILILWYGGFAVLGSGQHGLSIGHLITFNLYWNMLNTSITSLNGMLNTLVKAASAAQRVFEVIDLEPDIPDAEGDVDLVRGRPCSINFQAVRFIYPMRPENVVLHACSFSIGAGQTVAVVGRSGAGKSTLVGLLLRFYDPRGGQILVNGRPLTEYNLQLYRKRVGVVSQDTQVFCRSILENLTYGLEPGEVPPTEDIVAASKAANAHAFVEDLEDGYHSMIGEGGTRLSGGQRQRVAIGRALLRKPSLLLLDEATSALDAENEGKVQEALDELVHRVEGNCSVMLIAHRLSTVMSSDKIVVMDKGIVVEQGTHEELLKNQNIYAGLVQRQLAKQANTVSEAAEEEASASEVEPSRGKGWKGKMAELDAEGLKGKGKGKRKGKNGRGDAAEGRSRNAPSDSVDDLFDSK